MLFSKQTYEITKYSQQGLPIGQKHCTIWWSPARAQKVILQACIQYRDTLNHTSFSFTFTLPSLCSLAATNKPSLCGQSNCRATCGLIPWPLTAWESVSLSCRTDFVPAARLSWETQILDHRHASNTLSPWATITLHWGPCGNVRDEWELISDW